jgi:signal transduction histidine kinase
MHGGKIWFSSTGVRGEGSIFSITLPVYSLTLAG